MADCSDQGARNILRHFEELGIVTKTGDGPLKYDKNEAYFRFRRGHELAQSHSDTELRAAIADRWKQHHQWKHEFDTEHPSTVNIEQLHEEQGDDAVDELREWSATYDALQDHIEALEQLRDTKLILDSAAVVPQQTHLAQSLLPARDSYSHVFQHLNTLHPPFPDLRTNLLTSQTQTDITEFSDSNEAPEQS
ncbi:hypothetical protein GCM10008995_01930 [Halobellus salinus]|uniref:Uncharacterized protein n=2 Tax=Halobellus salinus TaxID=931585 RepID=A0A830ELL4_9EURY|nr:hypothetical protein GCM10008995_01930 [Halobellus salinus]